MVSTLLFVGKKKMPFTRNLSRPFIDQLNGLYESDKPKDRWWKTLVDDQNVFIAIRNNAINAYAGGASIGRIEWRTASIHFRVHVEYLIFAERRGNQLYTDLLHTGKPPVPVVVSSTQAYVDNLTRIKKIATMLSGEERQGENRIAAGRSCILDIEAAFNSKEDMIEAESNGRPRSGGRVDLVAINGEQLNFFEAKLLSNGELRAQMPATPIVCEQLCEYSAWLRENQEEVLTAYKKVVEYGQSLKGRFFKRFDNACEPASLNTCPCLLVYKFRTSDRNRVREIKNAVIAGVGDRIPGFDARNIICVGSPANVTVKHLSPK